MAETSAVCGICDERHIYRQSTDWCIDCEQALCTECKEFHAISKTSRNHATILITEYQSLASSISSVVSCCGNHDKKYQMFCRLHDKLLCPQCTEEHFDCKDVISLSKVTKNVKTLEAFREAEQCLADIDENIVNIENTIKDKIKLVYDQKVIILSKINKVRQKINEHLDQIEAVIKKDVSDWEHIARKELETTLKVLQKKKDTNLSCKQQLEKLRIHASDLQTFFALRQISSEITATEKFLQSVIDNGHLDKIAFEFSVNEKFRSISDKVETIGSVRVRKNPIDLTLVKQKENKLS